MIILGGKNLLPGTFLFEARNGIRGLLQITGFTENPSGVKLRYKLVQNAMTAQPAATPSGSETSRQ